MDTDTLKNEFKLDLANNYPLYIQLSNYIESKIKSGALKPGDQLITENQFCEILDISRTTVRLALNRLEKQELIIRRRGKGSFIADRKLKRNINYMYSFTENVKDSGVMPSSIVIESVVEEADERLVDLFKLQGNERKVFKLMRLRCGDEVPLLLECSYLPYYLCKGIEQYDFSEASLYKILESRYALNLTHAIETIEATLIDKESAKFLQCAPKALGYHIERTSFLDSGATFELTQSTTRADKTSFRLDLYKNQKENVNTVNFQRRVMP